MTLLFQIDPAVIGIAEGRSPMAIITLLAASQYHIVAVANANILGAANLPGCYPALFTAESVWRT